MPRDEKNARSRPKGNNEKKVQPLTRQDRASRRVEEIGFQWKINLSFEDRYRELIAFKEKFGHCNVPQRFAYDPSLGHWCSDLRKAYVKIKKGLKAHSNLSQDKVKRLEDIGFQWKVSKGRTNVPTTTTTTTSKWCLSSQTSNH